MQMYGVGGVRGLCGWGRTVGAPSGKDFDGCLTATEKKRAVCALVYDYWTTVFCTAVTGTYSEYSCRLVSSRIQGT